MCIGSNSVNQAQDLIFVTKFEDFPNSLIPIRYSLVTGHCEISLNPFDIATILDLPPPPPTATTTGHTVAAL